MPRSVVPVGSLDRRLPDAGRIRIGVKVPTKSGKSRPEKIDRFRFTSTDRQAIEQVAAIYGGTPGEWNEPKAAPGQWQVITEANELHIALPPDPLGNTPIYEMWGGGGCVRRCDGETCEMVTQGPDGLDMEQVACLCDAKGALECNLHTRLSVLLPDVRFSGVWRLDTKGRNAAAELPGMVDLIRSMQERGIVRATMRVEWRRQLLAGKTYEFAVPVLGIEETMDALAAGQSRVGSLPQAPAAGELVAGEAPDREDGEGRPVSSSVTSPAAPFGGGGSEPRDASPSSAGAEAGSTPASDAAPSPSLDDDEEIIDAEIVEEERPATGRTWQQAFAITVSRWVSEQGADLDADELRHALVDHATGGAKESSNDCDEDDRKALLRSWKAFTEGRLTIDPSPDGSLYEIVEVSAA